MPTVMSNRNGNAVLSDSSTRPLRLESNLCNPRGKCNLLCFSIRTLKARSKEKWWFSLGIADCKTNAEIAGGYCRSERNAKWIWTVQTRLGLS